jgi:hypothetical protein
MHIPFTAAGCTVLPPPSIAMMTLPLVGGGHCAGSAQGGRGGGGKPINAAVGEGWKGGDPFPPVYTPPT